MRAAGYSIGFNGSDELCLIAGAWPLNREASVDEVKSLIKVIEGEHKLTRLIDDKVVIQYADKIVEYDEPDICERKVADFKNGKPVRDEEAVMISLKKKVELIGQAIQLLSKDQSEGDITSETSTQEE